MNSTTTTRKLNFSAGPAVLPESVVRQAQEDLWDLDGTGIGLLEHSHRGKAISDVFDKADALCRKVGNIPEDFEILYLQGGASLQFSMIPMALLTKDRQADYINTGSWTKKAIEEAQRFGQINVIWDGKEGSYRDLPDINELKWNSDATYGYYCSNNTIYGTRWAQTPKAPTPLISDMSSEMYSRPIDWDAHDMIYAGAQKNLGPAGVTLVAIRRGLLEQASKDLPAMLRYDIHASKGSRYNTPPVFAVYFLAQVFEWIQSNGGLKGIEELNERKAAYIYDVIDGSGGFYTGHAAPRDRSRMNITFRCPSEELESAFIEEASNHDMANLKGHRSVGGLRASIYNAFPEAGCRQFAEFMSEFARTHG
ncbi:MAG: 3-phosphoserine/phosphohydroxythreonine transaminase [Phycisphaerales bacterium]|nr:3-phosphoserine/phosphohydroxythreonine transaminase [Phycisphaerales bacterium]